MALSDYLNDVQQVISDPFGSFFSQTQTIRYINQARRMCAARTGCVRRLITGQSAFGASAQPGFLIPGGAQPGSLPDASAQIGNASSAGSDFNSDFNSDFGPAGLTVGAVGAVTGKLMTIPNVERYPYEGFFNPALQAQHAGCDKISDSIDLAINWGSIRPSMCYLPWDDFQAYCRSYAVLNTSFPVVWSIDNDGPQGAIWLYPVPSQAGEMELDCFAIPKNLYTNDDFDVIPTGVFRDSIAYAAAALIYLATKRYADAQIMEGIFSSMLGIARVSVDAGKTASYY